MDRTTSVQSAVTGNGTVLLISPEFLVLVSLLFVVKQFRRIDDYSSKGIQLQVVAERPT